MINIYQDCPTLHTEHFLLRLVQESDAEDLLTCYSDPRAQAVFDFENCTSDFRYSTKEEMLGCIRFWLSEYAKGMYVRFSVIDKSFGKVVGTVEMFSTPGFLPEGNGGVLRIDLASRFETAEHLSELLRLANERFYTLFGADMIVIKGRPAVKNRVHAFIAAGYAPYDWQSPDREYYYIRRKTQ